MFEICTSPELLWQTDRRTDRDQRLMRSSSESQNTRVPAACWSHTTILRDQQNIVYIIYHTLVEQSEYIFTHRAVYKAPR